jgi:hypothetical protein
MLPETCGAEQPKVNAAAARRQIGATREMPSTDSEYHVANFCAAFDNKMSGYYFG